MIRALQEWHHYIQGSNHETIIYSDHKNLTYFRNAQKLNHRQAQWSLLLSEYDIKLIHLPGNKMILSDTLSQQPDFIPDKDTDNEDIVLLPDRLFQETFLPDVWNTPKPSNICQFNWPRPSTESCELWRPRYRGNRSNYLTKDQQISNVILKTGRRKSLKERRSYSFKERTTFPKTMNFDEKSPPNFMTKSLLDTQEKSRPSTPSKNTIGGPECEHSSRTM